MNKILTLAIAIALIFILTGASYAALVSKKAPYKHGDTQLEGYMVYDDAFKGKRPGVLIVHEWWGLNQHAKKYADRLAKMGYTAFALDMYGKGKVTTDPKQAGKWAGMYKNAPKLMRERAKRGLEILKKQPQTDKGKIAAIGFCFGGTTVLQLAYSDADVNAVVSFHGGLPAPDQDDMDNIKEKILVLHGADDPHVPKEEIKAFQQGMRKADADWQMIYYGNAVHSFTNPNSGDDPSKGAAYNEKATRRSWQHMKLFFEELFGKKKNDCGCR